MSENQLIPRKRTALMVPKKAGGLMPISKSGELVPLAVVNYEKTDPVFYSFSYRFDDVVELRMDESEQASATTEYVDVEFENRVEESDKVYYSLAAASGILTGLISMLHLKEEQLNAIDDFKEKEWKPIIIGLANWLGYEKSDYKGASRYLVKRAVRTVEKNEKTKEALTVLAEHPSTAGLIFCVITQFSGKKIILSETGAISKCRLPDYYTIGETNAEKIVCAVLYWLFSLGIDEAASKRRILDEMGISKDLLKKIKEFTSFPFFKNIPTDYSEAEKAFSLWLSKTIKGVELKNDEENEEKNEKEKRTNLFIRLMGVALNLAEDSFPVLVNECIVRSLYILIRLCSEVKERGITSFKQLEEIPVVLLLPADDRTFSRMCLIASASFAGANIAGATLKAIKEKRANGRELSETFFAELNIAGIGRFLFACAADSKYWGEDIRVLLQRKEKKTNDTGAEYYPEGKDTAFEVMTLDAVQARILYSLECLSVQYDISYTKKPKDAEKKALWLKTWKETLVSGIGIPPEQANEYFIKNETLYNGIYQIAQDKSNWRWFYLLTQELVLFEPYYALGMPEDKIFKKLKLESDYIRDQFIRRQTIVSQDEVDRIRKAYSKYCGYISGRTRNTIVGIGATAVIAVASGGLALTFAPGIAAAIAGEAVVGLHGAALTSASLAFVGGGSLAAGGLGMAGGTAIITGGGALIGLAGSGTVSAAAIMMQTSGDYWIRQSAKLLTFSNCILHENLKDDKSVVEILYQVDIVLAKTKKEKETIESEKSDLDKELLKKTEEYLKYLKKCRIELARITKAD